MKRKTNKKNTKKERILFYTSLCSLNMYFSFKFSAFNSFVPKIVHFFLFFKLWLKKKKIMHFHVCMSMLSLFYQSRKRQLMRKERYQQLINASDQKSADRITKVYLVLSGWGTSRRGRDLSAAAYFSSLLTFWSLAGGSDWLWLESTCQQIGICVCKAGGLKRHFSSPLPSCLLRTFYNHLNTQPETIGIVFGIAVLLFPNMLSG